MPEKLHDKINELNSRLLDVAEHNNVHILINITVVEGDKFHRTMGASKGFPPDQLLFSALGQSANVFHSISGHQ